MSVNPIPNESQPMNPYLIVKGAARAIDFYMKAFGAREVFRLTNREGQIGHAEIDVGAARIMLADEFLDFGALSPETVGGTPVSLHLYVADVDAVAARAADAGATVQQPPQDEFFGDRIALLTDPFGHKWHLATRKENIAPEEMQRRMDAAHGSP